MGESVKLCSFESLYTTIVMSPRMVCVVSVMFGLIGKKIEVGHEIRGSRPDECVIVSFCDLIFSQCADLI